MDSEEYQKKYSKWNFYKKLEDMYIEGKWIRRRLKIFGNWAEAYNYVGKLVDE